MKFEFPESVKLAHIPTPIEKLKKLTPLLEGGQLFIKRDDYTGLSLTGNKVRKLEFLFADALGRGCDSVITCGGIQSNHARATAVAAAKLGLTCLLILRDGPREPHDGNLFVNGLMGAEIEYVSADDYDRVDAIMADIADRMRHKGKKAYIIPEGGSNVIGVLGYIKAAHEIMQQQKKQSLKFDRIVVPVGSGGTYAGLLLGKHLFDLSAQITGINVCNDKSYFQKRILKLLRDAIRQFEFKISLTREDVHIVDGHVGKGYGLSSQDEIDFIKLVAKTEGILLDPVYTAKALLGITKEMSKTTFSLDEKILFIHTGGIFGLFPKRALFF